MRKIEYNSMFLNKKIKNLTIFQFVFFTLIGCMKGLRLCRALTALLMPKKTKWKFLKEKRIPKEKMSKHMKKVQNLLQMIEMFLS